ncbi:putative TLDc domain-containing protein [Seiridium cardinale]|uniref:TLDc domain-containing protein n=1 Tax=Seiridium cardinale TaxID=138064 RepID=A0ABR2XX76_9PEZI
MLPSLTDVLNAIALAPENWKVKRYLDTAKCDSVSADLGDVLSSQLSGRSEQELLQSIFDKYCIGNSSQWKRWDDKCFERFIRSAHSASAISDSAIQLLWRSFCFYAYHPFPRELRHVNVDFDGFKRAALLNVLQCDRLLGTRELEWYWRNDAAYFHRASFERIFRSIAAPDKNTDNELPHEKNDTTSMLSDAMDVLVMVGPQFMHAMPSTGQLETIARKLSIEGPAIARKAVTREESSILISLLLRVDLRKEKWGWLHHFGDVVADSPLCEGLTKALINHLTGGEDEQSITSDQLLKATNSMAS